MTLAFKKAVREQQKLRMALDGPAGAGKTYTAILLALALGKRVAVIDSEHGKAALYADQFDFDHLILESFHPERYIEAIQLAAREGYDVVVIDSLSHAWMGKDGALDLVDKAAKRSSSGNSFTAWRDVTPLHNKLVEALLSAPLHLIVTMRTKTEYVLETDSRGKQVPKKIGMQTIQRDGLEYEFDVVGDMDLDNNLSISKTRCSALKGEVINKPGKPLGDTLVAWLNSGEKPAEPKPTLVTETGNGARASSGQLDHLKTLIADERIDEGTRIQIEAKIKGGLSATRADDLIKRTQQHLLELDTKVAS